MRRSWFAVVSPAAVGAAVAAVASIAHAQTPSVQTPSAQTPLGQTPSGMASVAVTAGVRDPYEHTNRKIYNFNRGLDRTFLRPPAVFYHHAVPTPVRGGLHNMVTNLTGPIIFVNDVLQVRPIRAVKTLGRFVVNSTVGVGGMIDVGVKAGVPYHNADFGMTLARYGAPTGPYLFVPVLGPMTVRDAVGRGFDAFADPFNVINYDGRLALGVSRAGVGGIDARDGAEPVLKGIDSTATDPYVTIRSLYLQSRDAEIRGAPVTQQSVDALPDIAPASGAATPPSLPAPTTRPTSPRAEAAPPVDTAAPAAAPVSTF